MCSPRKRERHRVAQAAEFENQCENEAVVFGRHHTNRTPLWYVRESPRSDDAVVYGVSGIEGLLVVRGAVSEDEQVK